jgi:NADH-quinone oxidoreductase subunit L
MENFVKYLWLIPVLPLVAAAIGAVLKKERRRTAASLAIGAMAISLVLSVVAFAGTGAGSRVTFNFDWLTFGHATLQLGWVLDPLTAVMLVMVTFVSLLIFIYSIGYMSHDENFARFFCFLALFASAMLGIIIANSLLLLFVCWELVGVSSYLLIGFWFHKPSAAAAAKKAFITTRVGDIGLLLGMLWLYSQSGTLVFYDHGHGCLEQSALTRIAALTTSGGMAVSTAISLLIFCGAVGKSGQLPLHVWLPDAMEGPTPVSALIHAATMVAAGVFLVARVYPLMELNGTALQVVTWVGALTAVFAASIAIAQNDIKRILAYSTVSQLGYMMMGLGLGGVSVGMFHLLTHAFFKALLFLGAGSVIHGCHEEQDIRKMGGLRKLMPLTFATYAVGMMALCGVPLAFSGFWSKDAILHAARGWSVSSVPFYLGVIGAFMTAFYMTRQVCYVFFGKSTGRAPHESPAVMTTPLVILAACAVLAGFFGTPAWPWLDGYLGGESATFGLARLFTGDGLQVMLLSTLVVTVAILLGSWLYRRASREVDPLQKFQPALFSLLERKFLIDELYDATVVRLTALFSCLADWMDRAVWGGAVRGVAALANGLARLSRGVDESVVNRGFDGGCEEMRAGGRIFAWFQGGQTQRYLRGIGVAVSVLVLLLIWGCR